MMFKKLDISTLDVIKFFYFVNPFPFILAYLFLFRYHSSIFSKSESKYLKAFISNSSKVRTYQQANFLSSFCISSQQPFHLLFFTQVSFQASMFSICISREFSYEICIYLDQISCVPFHLSANIESKWQLFWWALKQYLLKWKSLGSVKRWNLVFENPLFLFYCSFTYRRPK